MNIAVVSLLQSDFNYGQVLQEFAMQTYLEQNGHSVVFLNYTRTFELKLSNPYSYLVWLKRKLLRVHNCNENGIEIQEFRNFLHISEPIKSFSTLKKVTKNVEALIVGSDVVWNALVCYNLVSCFRLLSWPHQARRISFAASFGADRVKKKYVQRYFIRKELLKYKKIGVRENSGKKICKELGVEASVVCDPTLLHDGNFYRNLCDNKEKFEREFIFVYKVREPMLDTIKDIMSENVVLVDIKKGKTRVSVKDWLCYIDNSKAVVTDSFHCVVFCILYHKNFVVKLNSFLECGLNERFFTLLSKVGLENRTLLGNEDPEALKKKLHCPINWNAVDSVIDEWRNYSKNWLNEALL